MHNDETRQTSDDCPNRLLGTTADCTEAPCHEYTSAPDKEKTSKWSKGIAELRVKLPEPALWSREP
jgi:hypothetical protein